MRPKLKKLYTVFSNDKGMALISVLMISLCLSMVASAQLSSVTHETGLIESQVSNVHSLYGAESGLEYGKLQLTAADNWINTTWNINDGAGGSVVITFDGNNPGTLTSTSSFQGNSTELAINVTGTEVGSAPFTQAACGCESLKLSLNGGDNVVVDSYIYSGETRIAGESGDVGCNGDVDLGVASVYGNVIAGDDLEDAGLSSVSGYAEIGGMTLTGGLDSRVHGGITQNVTPAPEPCDCDSIDIDDLIEDYNEPSEYNNDELGVSTNFSYTSSTPFTFTAGTYYFTFFSLSGQGQLIIDGEVIFIFDGEYSTFKITGQGISNSDDNVSNLKIYSNFIGIDNDTDEGKLKISGNGDFAGTIYAPDANIWLAGNGNISGGVIGDNVRISENVQLHYDENLSETQEPVGGSGEMTVEFDSYTQN